MRLVTTFFALSLASFLIVGCYESKPAPKFPVQDTAAPSPATPARLLRSMHL